ncbi:MAG: hypothetical protein KC620_23080 [Myxococcales bacterium]|nr:hypothetical protein [Myxococcales bacterium]
MAFDWMHVDHPPRPEAARAQAERTLRAQARLLRRLGHTPAYTLSRCRANLAWEYEVAGKPPLTDAEVEALVASVHG